MLERVDQGGFEFLTWPTEALLAHGKLFFMKAKRENQTLMFETIMLGSEEECKDYISSITILDKDSKAFATYTCHPRPISLEAWGDMGLMLPEKALARIWTPKDEGYAYKIELSIDKGSPIKNVVPSIWALPK